MSWLTPRLNRRIQIQRINQLPNTDGGFTRGYETLATVWAEIKPVDNPYVDYVRSVQTEYRVTHAFTVRYKSINLLNSYSFGDAFNQEFRVEENANELVPLKSEFFIFLEQGDSDTGRRFKINRFIDVKEKHEYYKIKCEETGAES